MSLKITYFLAWRYFKGTKEQKSLTAMIWICFLGIFIGTFSLGLTTCIMNGFETETRKKIQGILPDIILQAPDGKSLESQALEKYLTERYNPAIAGISDYGIHHVLLQKTSENINDSSEKTVIALLKTINPDKESLLSPLQEKVGTQPLTLLLTNNGIIIGKEIAKELDVSIGDSIKLFYNQTPELHIQDSDLAHTTVRITGFLDTGIADYDTTLTITSHDFLYRLLEKPYINQLGIKVNPSLKEKSKKLFLQKLEELPDIKVTTWDDQYPAIISALKLEKYVMIFLLTLITIVASMNSISLLFMFITYKLKEIALLQALGLSLSKIMLIFLYFNLIISAIASSFGLCCAYLTAKFLQISKCITLPDAYYVTHLPIQITLSSFLYIFLGTLLLSIVTTLLPIASCKTASITKSLRFE